MIREVMGGKLHLVRITQCNLDYEGSCAIDQNLLDAANILPFERIHIYNVNSGQRLDTYAIPGRRGSGMIGLNGAAARLAQKGDRVIIVTYVQVNEDEIASHRSTVIMVDEKNQPVKTIRHSLRSKS
ncbi:MAG TPA: aspartate 1-decarboxylase [bacterium]